MLAFAPVGNRTIRASVTDGRAEIFSTTATPCPARRADLLKIYAHCIDGQADAADKRITDTLGTQDTQPGSEPGDEGDDGNERAS